MVEAVPTAEVTSVVLALVAIDPTNEYRKVN